MCIHEARNDQFGTMVENLRGVNGCYDGFRGRETHVEESFDDTAVIEDEGSFFDHLHIAKLQRVDNASENTFFTHDNNC